MCTTATLTDNTSSDASISEEEIQQFITLYNKAGAPREAVVQYAAEWAYGGLAHGVSPDNIQAQVREVGGRLLGDADGFEEEVRVMVLLATFLGGFPA